MFRRLIAISRAPQGDLAKIDQIWAWLSRGHRWAPGVRNPLKSLVMGPCLLVNCYLEIKFHKKNQGEPPPTWVSLIK